jgi:hypothetical protein
VVLLLVGAVLGGYAVGMLVPYFVNDLHRLPLAEVASGRHDPKDLWPTTSPAAGLVQLSGIYSALLGPLLLPLAVLALGPLLVRRWSATSRGTRVLAVVALAWPVLGSLGMWSEAGRALLFWRLD